MEQQVKTNEAENRYELDLPEGKALITYKIDGDTMSVLHTEVPEAVEGQGIASKLAKFALDDARKRQLKVKVYCRFVKVFLQRHLEYQDLIVND